jgi:hypothetical protein
MCLRAEFRGVISVTISHKTMLGSSLPPVGGMGFMPFLRYVCVCLRIVVSNSYCVVVFVCLVFRVLYVASLSGLSIFYCSFGIL